MNITFIIQARLGSTRLPGKILLPFYEGKSILELMIDKLSVVSKNIVLAPSTNELDNGLELFAKKHCIVCFRGDENDVLSRFIDAASENDVRHLIRVCSDNPFLDLESIRTLISSIETSSEAYDYISFKVQGSPSIKTHYGFWTEYVSLSALEKVKQLTSENLYHEHVTNYIYTHPDMFRIKWLPVCDTLNDSLHIRLTIDTAEDFKNAQTVYSDLCQSDPYPTIKAIVDYLNSHPFYYQSMHNQIIKNTK